MHLRMALIVFGCVCFGAAFVYAQTCIDPGGGSAQLCNDNGRLICEQAAPGPVLVTPSGASLTLESCATNTLASTAICGATPTAGLPLCLGTDTKISTTVLPTMTIACQGNIVCSQRTGTGTDTGTATVTALTVTANGTVNGTSVAIGTVYAGNGIALHKRTGTGTSTATGTVASANTTDTFTVVNTATSTVTSTLVVQKVAVASGIVTATATATASDLGAVAGTGTASGTTNYLTKKTASGWGNSIIWDDAGVAHVMGDLIIDGWQACRLTGTGCPSAATMGGVPTSRSVSTTNGLQGGGDLSADRTLSPVYGSTANTVMQGNDRAWAVNGTGTASGTTNYLTKKTATGWGDSVAHDNNGTLYVGSGTDDIYGTLQVRGSRNSYVFAGYPATTGEDAIFELANGPPSTADKAILFGPVQSGGASVSGPASGNYLWSLGQKLILQDYSKLGIGFWQGNSATGYYALDFDANGAATLHSSANLLSVILRGAISGTVTHAAAATTASYTLTDPTTAPGASQTIVYPSGGGQGTWVTPLAGNGVTGTGRKLVTSWTNGQIGAVADMASSDVTTALGYTPVAGTGVSGTYNTVTVSNGVVSSGSNASYVSGAGSLVNGDLVQANGSGSVTDSGIAASSVLTTSNVSGTTNYLAKFTGSNSVGNATTYSPTPAASIIPQADASGTLNSWVTGRRRSGGSTTNGSTISSNIDSSWTDGLSLTTDSAGGSGMSIYAAIAMSGTEGSDCKARITVDGTQYGAELITTVPGGSHFLSMSPIASTGSFSAASHTVKLQVASVAGYTCDSIAGRAFLRIDLYN